MTQQHGLVAQALSPGDVAGEGSQVGLFASIGSQSLGGAGRAALGHGLTVSATIFETRATYDSQGYGLAILHPSVTYGGSLRWLLPAGEIRPFVEGGGWIAPDTNLEFRRAYMNGAGVAIGVSRPGGDLSYYYGRAGAVVDLRRLGRVTASGEFGRERLGTDGYDETLSNADPFEAHMATASDRLNIVKGQAAWTYDLGRRLGFTLNGGYAHGFDYHTSLAVSVPGIGTLSSTLRNVNWVEYGGSVSYRFLPHAYVAVFASGIAGSERLVGTETHAGIAIRVGF